MKNLNLLLTFAFALATSALVAQNVGIGTDSPADYAKLDIESTTSGLMLPRLTNAEMSALGSNIDALGAAGSGEYNGLMIYNTDDERMYMWDDDLSDFTNGGWKDVLDGESSVADGDSDPTNENQTVTAGSGISVAQTGQDFEVTNTAPDQTVSISGSGATSVSGTYPNYTISSTDNVNDADADATNELQDLSSSASGTNRTINISSGASTTISVADNDNSATNEIQTLSISGSTVSLSSGGGSVTVPGDNLGDHNATQDLNMGSNDILVSSGTAIENQASDQNIVILDDNPTWQGDVYGGVTKFYGDGNATGNKIEVGGIEVYNHLETPAITLNGVTRTTWSSGGDNLGNHNADQDIDMDGYEIFDMNNIRFQNEDQYIIQVDGDTDDGVRWDNGSHQWSWYQDGIERAFIDLDNGNFDTDGNVDVDGTLFFDFANADGNIDMDGFNIDDVDVINMNNTDIRNVNEIEIADEDEGIIYPSHGNAEFAFDATGDAHWDMSQGGLLIKDDVWIDETSTGFFGSADGFNFGGGTGGTIEQGVSESSGFHFNGDHTSIWAPDGEILSIYDEDGMDLDFYFNDGGNAYADVGWNTFSDERLKENIETIETALDKVLQLRGVTYDMKEDLYFNGDIEAGKEIDDSEAKNKIGFIAQEVEAVLPQVVSTSKHEQRNGIMAVNYSGVIPVLVEAMKEQQALIEDLQNQVDELDSILKALRAD